MLDSYHKLKNAQLGWLHYLFEGLPYKYDLLKIPNFQC